MAIENAIRELGGLALQPLYNTYFLLIVRLLYIKYNSKTKYLVRGISFHCRLGGQFGDRRVGIAEAAVGKNILCS